MLKWNRVGAALVAIGCEALVKRWVTDRPRYRFENQHSKSFDRYLKGVNAIAKALEHKQKTPDISR